MIEEFWYNVTMFKSILKPDCIIASFSELSVDTLVGRFPLALVDCDNTLIFKTSHTINEEGVSWMLEYQKKGGTVVLISNNAHPIFKTLAKILDCELYEVAFKPVSLYYRKILHKHHRTSQQVMVIGDQLLTDILGGKLHHFYTIYHKPLTSKDVGYNGVIRRIEKKWIEDYEQHM